MRRNQLARAASTLLFVLCSQQAYATDYYVDSTVAQDGTGTLQSPWRTLAKVNGVAFNAGDRVLFKRGGTWQGTLALKNGVTYDAYPEPSTLPRPIIRASTYVGSLNWSLYQGAIYVADVSSIQASGLDIEGNDHPPAITQVMFGATRLQRARAPNVGEGAFGVGQNRFWRSAHGSGSVADSALQLLIYENNTIPAQFQNDASLSGAQVLTKNHSWAMTRYTVDAVESNRAQLTLMPDPTWSGTKDQPVRAQHGYWLENKLWMLDKPGEWVYADDKLYVRLPNGSNPSGQPIYASTNVHAAVGKGVRQVTVKNLELRESRSDALAISGAGGSTPTNVLIDNILAVRSGGMGIKVIHNANGSGTISNSTVVDSMSTGIYLGSDATRNIHVVGNTVRNAGMGGFAAAAIWLGNKSNASDNAVSNASFIGIKGAKGNTIARNVVSGSCMQFDDCGGIYVRGKDVVDGASQHRYDIDSTIANNYVDGARLVHALDRRDGVPSVSSPFSGTNGIYLDDFSRKVVIQNNFVTGFDTGVMLHHGRENNIIGNRLVDNLRTQIYIQEDNYAGSVTNLSAHCEGILTGCDPQNFVFGNVVQDNVLHSKQVRPMIEHTSDFAGTADFAAYANNAYASPSTAPFAAIGGINRTFSQWRQTLLAGSPTTYQDEGSTLYPLASGGTPLDTAANMIANGDFGSEYASWQVWRGVTPSFGPSGCVDGSLCLSTAPDATAQVFGGRKQLIVHTTGAIAVTQGQKYIVMFDVQGSAVDDTVNLNLTKKEVWTSLSNYSGALLDAKWQRHFVVLTANASSSGDVRLDFEFRANGTVRLDNVRMVRLP